MRIIAFGLDAPTIERILAPIGEPTQPPAVLPARSPQQGGVRRRIGGWRIPIGGLIDALGRGVSQ
jgi:hypothetical protein